jgi:hypothetical protein
VWKWFSSGKRGSSNYATFQNDEDNLDQLNLAAAAAAEDADETDERATAGGVVPAPAFAAEAPAPPSVEALAPSAQTQSVPTAISATSTADAAAAGGAGKVKGVGRRGLKEGMRVSVWGYGAGTVRFIGKHAHKRTKRVGVELDQPVGLNNGTINGHTYFVCEEGHGLLVVPSKAVRLSTSSISGRRGSVTSICSFSGRDSFVLVANQTSYVGDENINAAEGADGGGGGGGGSGGSGVGCREGGGGSKSLTPMSSFESLSSYRSSFASLARNNSCTSFHSAVVTV